MAGRVVWVSVAPSLARRVTAEAVGTTFLLAAISGAHFNPAVTLADAAQGGRSGRDVPAYIAAQIVGAFAGVAAAHVMFAEPLFFASRHARAGGAQVSGSSWPRSGCAR